MAKDSDEAKIRVIEASELSDKIQKGEDIEFDDYSIRGDLFLSQIDLLRNEKDRKIVASQIILRNCRFKGVLNFTYLNFEQPIDFSGSNFEGNADFTGSYFEVDAEFASSNFEGNANFFKCNFKGDANFSGSNFKRYTNFSQSNFERYADFRGSRFEGDAYFLGSNFKGDANFSGSNCEGNANFSGSRFEGDSPLKESELLKKNADVNRVQFQNDAKTQERDTQSQKIPHLNDELDRIRSQLKQDIYEATQQWEMLNGSRSQNIELKKDLDAAQATIQQLQAELRSKQTEVDRIAALREELVSVKIERDKLQEALKVRDEDVVWLRSHVAQLTQQLTLPPS
jgi:hypothetical protein